MALSVTITDSRIIDQITNQTAATTIGSNNVVGKATTLHSGVVTSVAAEVDYLKVYDRKSATDSDAPDAVIPCAASGTTWFSVPAGIILSTGLSVRAVQEGGTAGTTNPSGNVAVKLVTT